MSDIGVPGFVETWSPESVAECVIEGFALCTELGQDPDELGNPGH
jgi:hypothetical protein